MAKEKFGRMAVSQIKNTAKSCYLLTREKEKLEKEIAEKQARLAVVKEQYDEYQAPIKRMTGGYTTEDLLDRQVTDTGKVDKDGRPIKVTNYVLRYPETVVPPVENVENTAGSDPDIDTQCPADTDIAEPTID